MKPKEDGGNGFESRRGELNQSHKKSKRWRDHTNILGENTFHFSKGLGKIKNVLGGEPLYAKVTGEGMQTKKT